MSTTTTDRTAAGSSGTSEESETRRRLIRAAEHLVADRGVDAVSVRSICSEADLNPAAVHYHYGNKDALLAAVLETRMGEVSERRLALLRQLDDEEQPTATQVASALVRPLAEVAASPDGREYVRFLTRMSTNRGVYRDELASAFAPQLTAILAVLERALPDVSTAVLTFRLALAGDVLLSALGEPDRDLVGLLTEEADTGNDEVLTTEVTDFVAGALAGTVNRTDTDPA